MKILTQEFLNFINENADQFIKKCNNDIDNDYYVDNCYNWIDYIIDSYNEDATSIHDYWTGSSNNGNDDYINTYEKCLDYIIRSIADYL